MVLIAPDKYKGTLTAEEATDIIARALGDMPYIKAPMADGGEGTAAVLCRGPQWVRRDCYYEDAKNRIAVIDSSAVIGLQGVDLSRHDILTSTSAPLGTKVREIIDGGCEKVIIGIGGTSTCDGGMGFIEGIGKERLEEYKHRIVGMSDVRVPLIAEGDSASALTFARQKGASDRDMEVLRKRLTEIYEAYPGRRSVYDGAGGGLGFAIASVIGAECYDGAQYVLDSYQIDWGKIDLIITGEGSIDGQSRLGKVVGTLWRVAESKGIPIIAIGGRVDPGMESDTVINSMRYYPDLPLNHETAAKRLSLVVRKLDFSF